MYGNAYIENAPANGLTAEEDPIKLREFEERIARAKKLNLWIGCRVNIANN